MASVPTLTPTDLRSSFVRSNDGSGIGAFAFRDTTNRTEPLAAFVVVGWHPNKTPVQSYVVLYVDCRTDFLPLMCKTLLQSDKHLCHLMSCAT